MEKSAGDRTDAVLLQLIFACSYLVSVGGGIYEKYRIS